MSNNNNDNSHANQSQQQPNEAKYVLGNIYQLTTNVKNNSNININNTVINNANLYLTNNSGNNNSIIRTAPGTTWQQPLPKPAVQEQSTISSSKPHVQSNSKKFAFKLTDNQYIIPQQNQPKQLIVVQKQPQLCNATPGVIFLKKNGNDQNYNIIQNQSRIINNQQQSAIITSNYSNSYQQQSRIITSNIQQQSSIISNNNQQQITIISNNNQQQQQQQPHVINTNQQQTRIITNGNQQQSGVVSNNNQQQSRFITNNPQQSDFLTNNQQQQVRFITNNPQQSGIIANNQQQQVRLMTNNNNNNNNSQQYRIVNSNNQIIAPNACLRAAYESAKLFNQSPQVAMNSKNLKNESIDNNFQKALNNATHRKLEIDEKTKEQIRQIFDNRKNQQPVVVLRENDDVEHVLDDDDDSSGNATDSGTSNTNTNVVEDINVLNAEEATSINKIFSLDPSGEPYGENNSSNEMKQLYLRENNMHERSKYLLANNVKKFQGEFLRLHQYASAVANSTGDIIDVPFYLHLPVDVDTSQIQQILDGLGEGVTLHLDNKRKREEERRNSGTSNDSQGRRKIIKGNAPVKQDEPSNDVGLMDEINSFINDNSQEIVVNREISIPTVSSEIVDLLNSDIISNYFKHDEDKVNAYFTEPINLNTEENICDLSSDSFMSFLNSGICNNNLLNVNNNDIQTIFGLQNCTNDS